jgi:hypothetical protein
MITDGESDVLSWPLLPVYCLGIVDECHSMYTGL